MGTEARARRDRQVARCTRPHVEILPPWTPLMRAQAVLPNPTQHAAQLADTRRLLEKLGESSSEADAQQILDRQLVAELWINSRYQVAVFYLPNVPGEARVIHLSIKRLDRQPPGPERWRDFQAIKNQLVGPECEAVELFPAESRVVDMANQYHLWAVDDPAFRFPVGFPAGIRDDQGDPDTKAVQRPFDA